MYRLCSTCRVLTASESPTAMRPLVTSWDGKFYPWVFNQNSCLSIPTFQQEVRLDPLENLNHPYDDQTNYRETTEMELCRLLF